MLGSILDLIDEHEGAILGRIWIKAPGEKFDSRSVYTYSIQDICASFQRLLKNNGEEPGIILADSRNKALNSIVSHSIFTKKFRAHRDAYPSIVELPVFGHSDNHAGLQLADLLCSALLFPGAIETYCKSRLMNSHVRDYSLLKKTLMPRIKKMQFRYWNTPQKQWRGGIIVSDKLARRSGKELFQ